MRRWLTAAIAVLHDSSGLPAPTCVLTVPGISRLALAFCGRGAARWPLRTRRRHRRCRPLVDRTSPRNAATDEAHARQQSSAGSELRERTGRGGRAWDVHRANDPSTATSPRRRHAPRAPSRAHRRRDGRSARPGRRGRYARLAPSPDAPLPGVSAASLSFLFEHPERRGRPSRATKKPPTRAPVGVRDAGRSARRPLKDEQNRSMAGTVRSGTGVGK